MAFGMEDEKEGGKWQTSALEQEEWFGKIEDGVARFIRKWYARETEASAKRQLARADVADVAAAAAAAAAAKSAAPAGPKRKRKGRTTAESAAPAKRKSNGGAPGRGKKEAETAVETARAAGTALVAQHIPD